MARVPVKDSKPEKLLRSALFSRGFRFRKNYKGLSGSPDIVLPKYNTVVFVHGWFWHYHKNCKYSKIPSSNVEFWTGKLEANVKRDNRNVRLLKKAGWQVITVWQCQLRPARIDHTLVNMIAKINRSFT